VGFVGLEEGGRCIGGREVGWCLVLRVVFQRKKTSCAIFCPDLHPMVFVGSIWKSKSGWFLCVMSPGLSVATEVLLTAGVHH
jgi:hypothetical protein